MSESMDRLLLAAKKVGLNSAADIARALNIGDQATTNWRSRKVPGSAAAKLQASHGISAAYVVEGKLPMLVSTETATEVMDDSQKANNFDIEAASNPRTFEAQKQGIPLSTELIERLSTLSQAELLRAESLLRIHLNMPPFTAALSQRQRDVKTATTKNPFAQETPITITRKR